MARNRSRRSLKGHRARSDRRAGLLMFFRGSQMVLGARVGLVSIAGSGQCMVNVNWSILYAIPGWSREDELAGSWLARLRRTGTRRV